MKIWAHRYELVPKVKGFRARQGVLLKVEWAVGQVGYSDLHPWPEFGEPALDTHLVSLSEMKFTRLAELSLEYNYIDREYRLLKRNAFLGLILPRSHKLVFDVTDVEADQLREWEEAGFSHIKVKMGEHLKEETDALVNLAFSTKMLWRIDMNARLSETEFTSWWKSIDDAIKARLDFIEDPISEGQLSLSGPWANDWKQQARARVRILKPARESIDDLHTYDRVIFTHGLDHPMGQAASAWVAAKFYSRHPKMTEVCGLAGADVYERDSFSKVWFCEGPRLKPTSGSGFGFDEILENLSWERIL
jgi:O-succinylbenzoate synthase